METQSDKQKQCSDKFENDISIAPETDIVEDVIGAVGKYQIFLCLLIFLTNFPIAFHQMAIIFLAPPTPFLCLDTNTNDTCPCSNPQYNSAIFESTIISEWDLVCNSRWMGSFAQTIFQLGTLLGSLLFGMASDRFGRKRSLLVAVVIQTSMGIGAAYISGYWTFNFVRFLVGMSVGGTMVVGFVICIEFIGTKYRDMTSALYQIPFNMGHLLLPVFSYFFRDFRNFQLSISLPTVVLLSYFFLVPETPRWLFATGKAEKALPILERVAKINTLFFTLPTLSSEDVTDLYDSGSYDDLDAYSPTIKNPPASKSPTSTILSHKYNAQHWARIRNGMPTDNIQSKVKAFAVAEKTEEVKNGTVIDLMRTPNIRKNNLVMAFNWLTCSYCFYGVSQYVSQLSGNIFLNVAISATMALLGSCVSIPLMRMFERKSIVIVSHFICAICLVLLAMVPAGFAPLILASTGVVTSFIVLLVVYLYCTELFPTVIRSAALGFSSMSARAGSMVAPFIIDLGQTAVWLPPILFAILPLVCGFLTFLLPETKGCELMTTLEEGENFGTKASQQNRYKK